MEKSAHKKRLSHFLFLDSFRGLMAIIICIAHIQKYLGNPNPDDILSTAQRLATPLALPGFFILSSFLLTYRLLSDMSHSKSSLFSFQFILILIKYFIRRFFRIYVVFFVYCSISCMLPRFYEGKMRDAMMPAWASW